MSLNGPVVVALNRAVTLYVSDTGCDISIAALTSYLGTFSTGVPDPRTSVDPTVFPRSEGFIDVILAVVREPDSDNVMSSEARAVNSTSGPYDIAVPMLALNGKEQGNVKVCCILLQRI